MRIITILVSSESHVPSIHVLHNKSSCFGAHGWVRGINLLRYHGVQEKGTSELCVLWPIVVQGVRRVLWHQVHHVNAGTSNHSLGLCWWLTYICNTKLLNKLTIYWYTCVPRDAYLMTYCATLSVTLP